MIQNSFLSAALPSSVVQFVHQLYHDVDRPEHYFSGAVREHEMILLAQIYFNHPPERSLEWGLGSGISAASFAFVRQVLQLGGKHIALDPFQEEISRGWGLRCLDESGQADNVSFHATTSEHFLVAASQRGEAFDFVFIDGAHDMGHKLTDACLANEVTSPGGLICFHDSFFDSTATAVQYLIKEAGFSLLNTGYESRLRRYLRSAKHARRLGWRYAWNCGPLIDYSVSVLRKPA
jgi:predicted O-methyltransferase YrrM